jgi:hypothetical protein
MCDLKLSFNLYSVIYYRVHDICCGKYYMELLYYIIRMKKVELISYNQCCPNNFRKGTQLKSTKLSRTDLPEFISHENQKVNKNKKGLIDFKNKYFDLLQILTISFNFNQRP